MMMKLHSEDCRFPHLKFQINCIFAHFCPSRLLYFWSSPLAIYWFQITSQLMDLAACYLNLWESSVWGRSIVWSCYFHFWMMALILLMEILSSLEIFWYLTEWLWYIIITINFLRERERESSFAIAKIFAHSNQKFNNYSKYIQIY